MTQADVAESADGRFVVRIVNGVGIPLEYRCATAAEAKALLEVLGMEGSPRARAGRLPAGPYRVELSQTAREEIDSLPDAQWDTLRRAVAEVAVAAGEVAPPSRAMLLAAGVQPPVLRLREGPHVVVYETDPAERTLNVLHVLEVG